MTRAFIQPDLIGAFVQGGPGFPPETYRRYCEAEAQAVAIDIISATVPGQLRLPEWVEADLQASTLFGQEKKLGYMAVMRARHNILAERTEKGLLRPRILMARAALEQAGDFRQQQAARLLEVLHQGRYRLAFADDLPLDECGDEVTTSIALTLPNGEGAVYSQMSKPYGRHETLATEPVDVALRRSVHRRAWRNRLPDGEAVRILTEAADIN